MRKIKLFYILAFIGGGFLVMALAYLLLRASGIIYKLTPDSDSKWIEYEA